MLPSHFFINNRKRLVELLPAKSIALIPAHRVLQRSADVNYPFYQDSNFFYLSGLLKLADGVIVLAPSATSPDLKEFLIRPKPTELKLLWEGTDSDEQLRKVSGISTIIDRETCLPILRDVFKNARVLLTPSPVEIRYFQMTANPARAQLKRWLKKHFPNSTQKDLRPDLAKLRMVKNKLEIERIQAAIDITGQGLKEAYKRLKPGVIEHELETEILKVFRASRANAAWEPVIAAGKNACTIHYDAKTAECQSGDLVLFDVGAEVDHYAADISRTVSVSGQFSARQKEVHEAVRDIQNKAIKLLKPGITFMEWQKKVDQLTCDALINLNLITAVQLKRNPKAFRKYYPHMSHFLGLDVHDAGDYQQPLRPNMVLTVEPGIYIEQEGIGVRIEDDILITNNGTINLSQNV
jgi:Xaa-Pro aminopeptidase